MPKSEIARTCEANNLQIETAGQTIPASGIMSYSLIEPPAENASPPLAAVMEKVKRKLEERHLREVAALLKLNKNKGDTRGNSSV